MRQSVPFSRPENCERSRTQEIYISFHTTTISYEKHNLSSVQRLLNSTEIEMVYNPYTPGQNTTIFNRYF